MELVPARCWRGIACFVCSARAAGGRFTRTLARLARGKKTTLKAALSDQRRDCRLGNIYVCEALQYARLSPRRVRRRRDAWRSPAAQSARRLVARSEGADGCAEGGDDEGQTIRPRLRSEGEPCVRRGCAGRVRRIVQSGTVDVLLPHLSGVTSPDGYHRAGQASASSRKTTGLDHVSTLATTTRLLSEYSG